MKIAIINVFVGFDQRIGNLGIANERQGLAP